MLIRAGKQICLQCLPFLPLSFRRDWLTTAYFVEKLGYWSGVARRLARSKVIAPPLGGSLSHIGFLTAF
jgi:hypothetical protein